VRVGGGVGADAPEGLGDGDAEHAEPRHLSVDRGRKTLAGVELAGNRTDLSLGERSRSLVHHAVTVGRGMIDVDLGQLLPRTCRTMRQPSLSSMSIPARM